MPHREERHQEIGRDQGDESRAPGAWVEDGAMVGEGLATPLGMNRS